MLMFLLEPLPQTLQTFQIVVSYLLLSLESTKTFLCFYLLLFFLCSSSFSLKGNASSCSICLSPEAVHVRSIPVNIWQIYRNMDHVLTFATYTKKKALFHFVKHHITLIFFHMHRSISSQIHGMPVLQLLLSHIGYGWSMRTGLMI